MYHNKTRLLIPFVGFFILIGYQNCAKQSFTPVEATESYSKSSSTLDSYKYTPHFDAPSEISQIVISDLEKFAQLEGLDDQTKVGSYYQSVFGKNVQSRMDYLKERIQIFTYTDPEQKSKKVKTVASNIGAELWLRGLAMEKSSTLKLYNQDLTITSPKQGIVELESYKDYQTIFRISTLVHEARHSDCTGGVPTSLISAYKENITRNANNDIGQACLHAHAICPHGHELSGYAACDSHLWGAYAIGGMFSAMIEKYCKNCSEEEIQQASLDASEQLNRVIKISKIKDKTAAKPDMTHSAQLLVGK